MSDLETFRHKWREELSRKQINQDRGNANGESSSNEGEESATISGQECVATPGSVNIKFNDNVVSPSARSNNPSSKPEVSYYPFDIVCNLLNFERNSQKECQTKDLKSPVVKKDCQKRQAAKESNNKSTKKVKLKDIFSNKLGVNDASTGERILEKFISDLVKCFLFH
jgi:hypothetical protein